MAVLIFGFSLMGKSQLRLDTLSWKERFTMFLQEENGIYVSDEMYPGNFLFNLSGNPEVDFKKLNSGLFLEPSPKLYEYYFFLENLSPEKKHQLIRTFSFYENDILAVLVEAELPPELKYLPPAISAMNTIAVGDMHRTGIWQLTHFQAMLNGGQIDKLVDERLHPLKSIRFATRQLKNDFEIYNDYNLAVAALICGNTQVKNVLAKAGENAEWNEIIEILPENFQETVAAFQAMTVFLNTNEFVKTEEFVQEKPDTIILNQQIHFDQLSRVAGINNSELQFLNPQFKHSIIPASEKTYQLALPVVTKNEFLTMQDSVLETGDSTLFQIAKQRIEYPPEPLRSFIGQAAKDIEIEGKTRLGYMLKSGDVLGIIAEKFDVSVTDLKYWNNIYNERRIRAGQKISVFVPDEKARYFADLFSNNDVTDNDYQGNSVDYSDAAKYRKMEHVVQNGESPFVIAQKYDGVTPEAILLWNHIDNARKIQIGQKLILYIPK